MNRADRDGQRQIRLRVYGQLPTIGCKGLCTASCGPIAMSALERRIIEERSGRALDVHDSVDEMRCNHLVSDRCSVYSDRPLLCRLFGIAEGMECSHGCRPSRLLSRMEGAQIIELTAEIGGPSTFGPIAEELFAHIAPNFPGRPEEADDDLQLCRPPRATVATSDGRATFRQILWQPAGESSPSELAAAMASELSTRRGQASTDQVELLGLEPPMISAAVDHALDEGITPMLSGKRGAAP